MKNIQLILFAYLLLIACNTREKKSNSKEEETKKYVKEWILANADYPDSYSSISFRNFEEIDFSMPNIPNTKFYRIEHQYTLKSRKNELLTKSHFFVLKDSSTVSLITEYETSLLQSMPPSVFDWAIEFGEKFKNVDYGGLTENRFIQKFQDYKMIGGNIWTQFHYLNEECKEEFSQAINRKNKQKWVLKRVINASPTFKSNLDSL